MLPRLVYGFVSLALAAGALSQPVDDAATATVPHPSCSPSMVARSETVEEVAEPTSTGVVEIVDPNDPDAETYVEFNPEEEYVEFEEGVVNGTAAERRSILGNIQRPCEKLAVRKEWREMTLTARKQYIDAVKCLRKTKRFNSSLPLKFNRYDEYVISHMNVSDEVHGVAQFLPWHRHFGHLYEEGLRNICGYRGAFPYWDWTKDTVGGKPPTKSPVFDNTYGFGGDGVIGTYTMPTDDDGSAFPLTAELFKGCVKTGPFAGAELHVGPNKRFTDHCLTRGWMEQIGALLNPQTVKLATSQKNYNAFWNQLDGMPFKPEPRVHDSGHAFMGGDMSSFYTSPNDPVFFLHHATLDRIWWQWQKADLPKRLYAMEGQKSFTPPYGKIDLNYKLPYAGVFPSVRLRDAMDPRMEPYCYTYL